MKKACMVVHSYYPADPRVRRETEALLGAGWQVDIVCLREPGQLPAEECGGARVHRLPIRRHRGGGLAIYLLEYLVFFVMGFWYITWLHLRKRFDVVQAHNMPDFLVFMGLIPRLLGARVLLDIHDLVPELYMLKFGGRPDHPAVRLTRWFERQSTSFADHVITAGEPFRRRLVSRGVPAEKITVIMNTADPRIFDPERHQRTAARSPGQFRMMYHGGIFERYGLDIAIRAVDRVRREIPGVQLDIYGQGEATDDLARLITELKLGEHVHLRGFVTLDTIPQLIVEADVGVVPYRSNLFTELLYPTKAFEYMVMGVPTLMTKIESVTELFADLPGSFFEPDSVEELSALLLKLYREPEHREQLVSAARRLYEPYKWERQRQNYVALMEETTVSYGPQVDRTSY
jgi:glycosyltransferase involved in cell wall biosynthesis